MRTNSCAQHTPGQWNLSGRTGWLEKDLRDPSSPLGRAEGSWQAFALHCITTRLPASKYHKVHSNAPMPGTHQLMLHFQIILLWMLLIPQCSKATSLLVEKSLFLSWMGPLKHIFKEGLIFHLFLPFLLSILGAKKNFSKDEILPATALLRCSVSILPPWYPQDR